MRDMGYPSREWAIRWLRGSLVGYLKGSINKKMMLGRMKKCYETYSLSLDDIKALVESLVVDPSVDFMTFEMRRKVLNDLMEEFKSRVVSHGPPK